MKVENGFSSHTPKKKHAKEEKKKFWPNEILVRARSHCLRSPLIFWWKFWSIRCSAWGKMCASPLPRCHLHVCVCLCSRVRMAHLGHFCNVNTTNVRRCAVAMYCGIDGVQALSPCYSPAHAHTHRTRMFLHSFSFVEW